MAKKANIVAGLSLTFAVAMTGTATVLYKENQAKDKMIDTWEDNSALVCNQENISSLFSGKFCDNAEILKIINDGDWDKLDRFKADIEARQDRTGENLQGLINQIDSFTSEFVKTIEQGFQEAEEILKETTETYKTTPNKTNPNLGN